MTESVMRMLGEYPFTNWGFDELNIRLGEEVDKDAPREVLVEQNRAMRKALEDIIQHPPKYQYASAASHPDTNTANAMYWTAAKALSVVDTLWKRQTEADDLTPPIPFTV